MKGVFYSSPLNYQQLPCGLEIDRLTEGNFTFAAASPVPEESQEMGYCDMNKQYPFVLTTYDSEENS